MGGRALAARVTRVGYYWPRSLKDVEDFANKCLKCQERKPVPHCSPEELTSITAPWLFAQWGLDLIGPFPAARGGAKFVIFAVDYFTKWVEVEALISITSRTIMKFK